MRNKNMNTDALLKRALGNSEVPSPELVRKIKYPHIEEETILKKKTMSRSVGTIAAAVAACLLIPTTAFAAWHFLSPTQVAEQFENHTLAKAFSSNDALTINETQSDGGYDISLLGVVSGEGLTEFDSSTDSSATYAVVAIEKQEGAMPAVSDADYGSTPFFVSPVIHGQLPWQYNIASMNGGYSASVTDGIMYHLIECDNMEMFADRGLSLIVSSTSFYDITAFDYDESTGLVTPTPDFDGVNVVFDLPLDAANADYAKAQEYLDTLWEENTNEAERTPPADTEADKELTITDEGSIVKEVMTLDTMPVWIENQLALGQERIARGEYSEESLALDRKDYKEYLQAVKDGKEVTIYTYEDGSYVVGINDPAPEGSPGFMPADMDVNADGVEITIGK